MSNQSEPNAPKSTSAAASKKATRGKGKRTPGVEYGNLSFVLPLALERSLRFVCFQLEVNPKATFKTEQAIVEESVRRYLETLSKHMPITPPTGLPETKAPSEPAS